MAFKFPLYHRSGCLIFLDDDIDYLEMLGLVVPTTLQVELFSRPSAFLARMKEEPAKWESDAGLHLQMLDRWRHGQNLLPQVLNYWSSHPARYQLVQTCVIDFAMPGIDGLKVLESLIDWPGYRILLTGQADDTIATDAFNNGLIDQFIPKHTADIAGRLLTQVLKNARTPQPRLNTIWRTALQPGHQTVLEVPSIAGALQKLALENWIEYVVLGEPFGMLGLTADGQCEWLQLEPTAGLKEVTDLGRSAGLGFDTVQAIQGGKRLPAIEVHQQLGLEGPIRMEPAFPIGEDGLLIGARFALAASDLPQPIYPYRNFLDMQGLREIQDI
ncbi:response regulator [Hydrogenophaga sp.]|uniref:response regulator n=1 Tax=Hydrogenophaga sp. TaxID=1904254 RepID=UPI0035B36A54